MIQVIRQWEGLITIKEQDYLPTDVYFWEAVEVKAVKAVKVEKTETEHDMKEIRAKLKEKWVKFFPWAKDDKIIELAKENNII